MGSTCPSCGGPVDEISYRCPRCGQSTTRRPVFAGPTPPSQPVPASEVALPCVVPDARFVAGELWTHGILYLTDLGLYLLSETDGPWTPERLTAVVAHDTSQPVDVAPSSRFLPRNRIERFQHSRLTSFSIFTRDGKKPLRLSPEGWRTIDSYAAKSGIPTT